MKRVLLIFLGYMFLIFGGIGVFLPVLPTTPFVLLAAGCFSATSPKMYERLAKSKFFGEYLRNYKEKTGISNRTRWSSIAILWLILGISIWFAEASHIKIVLCMVGGGVTIHLLTIRRAQKDLQTK